MRKTTVCVAAAAMALTMALAGCGSSSSTSGSTTSEASSQQEQSQPAEKAQTAEQDFSVTIDSCTQDTDYEGNPRWILPLRSRTTLMRPSLWQPWQTSRSTKMASSAIWPLALALTRAGTPRTSSRASRRRQRWSIRSRERLMSRWRFTRSFLLTRRPLPSRHSRSHRFMARMPIKACGARLEST